MSKHYFVKEGKGDPQEVTQEEFKDAEERAGFHPKIPGELATAGFSHSGPDLEIEGAIADTEQDIEKVISSLRGEKSK